MSDPSYKGQMVVFTCPHIGNVGVNAADMESKECHMEGIIVRSLSKIVSNYRAEEDLDAFCKRQGLIGIAGVDTRGITMRVREKGALAGVVCGDGSVTDDELLSLAKSWSIEGKDLISEVTTGAAYDWARATSGRRRRAILREVPSCTTDGPEVRVALVLRYILNIRERSLPAI